MADEQALISDKISSIRETLSKLSKSIKSADPPQADSPDFDPFPATFKPNFPLRPSSQDRDSAILQQELGEINAETEENSYKNEELYDRQQFTLEDYIQPRADSPLHSFRAPTEGNRATFADLRATAARDAQVAEAAYRDKRDQIDILLDRISEKDRTIREQSAHFTQLQDQLESIKSALKQAKQSSEKEKSDLELELDREKRLRNQAEAQLREAVLDAEEAKIQLKLRMNQGSSDKAWKSDLAALQNKLEDTSKLKITLLGENAELHKTVQGKELDILRLKEELRVGAARQREEITREDTFGLELKTAQKEVARLKRENEELRQKDTRSTQLERDKLTLEKELTSLRAAQLDSPRSPLDSDDFRQRVVLLEQQLSKAMSENDNLYLELSSRPTHKQMKEKERVIEELREEMGRSKRTKEARSVSPRDRDSGGASSRRRRSETEASVEGEAIIADVMSALRVSSQGDILRKIAKLKKAKSSAEKLIGRLSSLVQECSPQGLYPRSPSNKDIWKWTRRLAEEYMSIRQTHDVQKVNSDIMSQALELLGLIYPSEVPKQLSKLLDECKFMRNLLDKVKLHLSLPPRLSLHELDQQLSPS